MKQWKSFSSLGNAEKHFKRKLSLGVCSDRCQLHKEEPTCFVWTGIALAKTKRCPYCGKPLSRTSRWTWDGAVRTID